MTVERTTVLTAQAQAALVEWAGRWQEAARAAVEADAAEDEALRGPHEPGPEFSRALGAEGRYEAARRAQEEAWDAGLGVGLGDTPGPARDYALARGGAESLWVQATCVLDGMQSDAAARPGWSPPRAAPEGVREPLRRVARAAREYLVAVHVPFRERGEEEYERLAAELAAAREELAEACDALEGPPPGAVGRHPAWELRGLRAAAAAASDREAELAAELAAWVADNLGPPPGRLN